MTPMTSRLPAFGLVGLLTLVAAGATACGTTCGKTPTGVAEVAPMSAGPRIIVKLKDPAADPAQAGLLSELSRAAGAELVYLRAMSGGAHVLQVRPVMDEADGRALLRRLSAHPGVAYAEEDRMLRPSR